MDTSTAQDTDEVAMHRRYKDGLKKLMKRPLIYLVVLMSVLVGSLVVFVNARSTIALILGCSVIGMLLLSLPVFVLGWMVSAVFDSRPMIRLLRFLLCEAHLRQHVWSGIKTLAEGVALRKLDPYERSAVIDRLVSRMEQGDFLLGDGEDLQKQIVTEALASVSIATNHED